MFHIYHYGTVHVHTSWNVIKILSWGPVLFVVTQGKDVKELQLILRCKNSKFNYTKTYLDKDHLSLLTCIALVWWRHSTQQTPAPGTMVQVGIVPQKGQRTAQWPVTGNINYFCTFSVLDLYSSGEHKMAESDQPLSSRGASRIHWLRDWVGHWAGL